MKKHLLFLTICLALTVAYLSTNAQGTWTQKADLGTFGRLDAAGFSIGTKGYIGTGNYHPLAYPHPDSLLKDFWEWDQATNVWTQKANFSGTGRFFPVSFSIGSKGYFGTGTVTFLQGLDDFWEFDPAANTWTQKANFAGGIRQEAIGFSIGSKGYIGIGRDGQSGTTYNDLWEWDQATNMWSQKTNYPGTPKYNSVAFSINSIGYIATGLNDTAGYLKEFWGWDQTTNIWSSKAAFGGVGRCESVGFSIGNKGYVGTGSNEYWIGYKDFWEYDPNGNGINEIQNQISISISPNPFSSQTTLRSDKSFKNASLTVYNTFGQTVQRIDNLSGQTVLFQRDNLPSGLYFVRLTQNGNTISADKFVIVDQ